MPETVEAMPPRRAYRGALPRYDWPAIFDGQVHLFPLAELPSTPRNFARQVRRAASVYGLRVSVVTRKAKGVYIEAHRD